jgi:dihydrofolate reductase
MKLGLIDEYWLVVHPVVAGKGKRLFDGLSEKIDLKLVDTKVFRSGVVVLHYLDGKSA